MEIRREEIGLRRAEAEPIPDFYVRLGVAPNPINNQTFGYFRFNMEVPLWDRNQGNIVAARHIVAGSREKLRRLQGQLESRLASTFAHYQASLAAVGEYRDGIVPEASEAFTLYRDRFRDGQDSLPRVVISALRTYADARSGWIEALLDLRESEVAIIGLLLTDGTDAPDSPPGAGQSTWGSTP